LALPALEQALLERGGLSGVAQALEDKERALDEALKRHAELTEERAKLTGQLIVWEKDESASELLGREQKTIAAIEQVSERVFVDRIALWLLETARQRHEREHQPAVVRRASALLEELTAGRYAQIVIPFGEEREVLVRDGRGREWRPGELSRGTRELLYLAFRLAVIEDFGQTRVGLPILLDDVLVNFDPVRMAAAVSVLAKLSDRHQVIAFTCHPEVAARFEEHGANVVTLDAPPAATAQRPRRLKKATSLL
jgi:uncharacterized protein YhaN